MAPVVWDRTRKVQGHRGMGRYGGIQGYCTVQVESVLSMLASHF